MGALGGNDGAESRRIGGIEGDGVRGNAVAVAGVAPAVGDTAGRSMVGVADADCAGRGAAAARAGAAVAATARVAVGTTTVTSPRITASIVLSGVG